MKKLTLLLLFILFVNVYPQQYEIINGTFLGNEKRNYYGDEAPDNLNVLWKTRLGAGETVVGGKRVLWAGSGWTGQPLLISANDTLYIIQGSFDHNLKKLRASDGKIIWEYPFQDVIKGTGSVFIDENAEDPANRLVIMQGSRRGLTKTTASAVVPSFRAISFETGEELWRMNIPRTPSYSRDTDGSPLIIDGKAYLACENSTFIAFNPSPAEAKKKEEFSWVEALESHKLYKDGDYEKHRGNLVAESSPCLLGDRLYVTSGSGYVVGYNLNKREIDWEFYIGSDMDGSPVVTSDSCILVPVEKQYIDGKGGIFKLDPSKPAEQSVVWYFPVEDKNFASWKGGVIGSPAVNDFTKPDSLPYLAAFNAIDDYLYVVDYKTFDTTFVYCPNKKNKYPTPKLVAKIKTGPSITTPLFVKDKLVTTGYWGLRLYKLDKNGVPEQKAHFNNRSFESTPFVYDRKIYIGSRDGYFYCLGD